TERTDPPNPPTLGPLAPYLQDAPLLQFLERTSPRFADFLDTTHGGAADLKFRAFLPILRRRSPLPLILGTMVCLYGLCGCPKSARDGRFSCRFRLGTGLLGASSRAAARGPGVRPERGRPAELRGPSARASGVSGLRPPSSYPRHAIRP